VPVFYVEIIIIKSICYEYFLLSYPRGIEPFFPLRQKLPGRCGKGDTIYMVSPFFGKSVLILALRGQS